jgi:hypothetical protein
MGGRCIIMREVDVGLMLRLFGEHGVRHAFLAPAIINMVLQHPGQAQADLSRLDYVYYGASPISEEVAEQLSVAALAEGGQQGLNPVDPSGNPLPPPLKLPPGPGGKPNKWKPVQGTPARPIKWIPETPLSAPGGGQPGGSWDDEHGHWDVDNGLGDRVRVKPDGTLVGPDHEPTPGLELPSQFPGIDPAIVDRFACVAVVTLSITAGGLLIILIIWEVCSGVAWS